MVHIFTLHSPITFLMALWVYRHLQLKEEEVVIISANYKPPLPFGKIIPAFPDVNSGIVKKVFHFDVGKAFDRYVSKYIGDQPFTAYIDIMHTYQKLLVTHENCKAFHFMEEGTDSYMQTITLEDFTRTAVSERFRIRNSKELLKELVRTARGYTSGLHSLPYHAQSYQYNSNRKYFCLSNYCYPGVPNSQKFVLEPKLEKQECELLASNTSLSKAVLVVEETYPDKFKVSESEYQKVLRHALSELTDDNAKIYIKTRPSVNKDSTLLKVLNNLEISFEVLPKKVLAEGLFLNSYKLKVVGFVSSLLFYARLLGHESYSMLNGLQGRPKSRFDRINGFKNLVDDI